MNRRNLYNLLVILALMAVGMWIDYPGARTIAGKQIFTHKGLDLQGGVAILLKASPPAGQASVDSETIVAKHTAPATNGMRDIIWTLTILNP